jgi:riboflavin synthase
MFTGIVEEQGVVVRLERKGGSALLELRCDLVTSDAGIGDSISVNGCCLTVTERTGSGFVADMMGETLARTALGGLRTGDVVNLERALRLDGRLGGHLVQGHVDGVGRVRSVTPEGEWTTMALDLPADLAPYVAEKGSVAIDGVSLTVTAVDDQGFSVGLIPHTLAVTTLGHRSTGDRVNIEVDMLAKYVARLVGRTGPPLHQEER